MCIVGFCDNSFKATIDVVDCSVDGGKGFVFAKLDISFATLSDFDSLNGDDKRLLGFIPVN